jgi:hypothetical protein
MQRTAQCSCCSVKLIAMGRANQRPLSAPARNANYRNPIPINANLSGFRKDPLSVEFFRQWLPWLGR